MFRVSYIDNNNNKNKGNYMDISIESLAYIQNAIKTADLVGIDNIIIEPGKVRAMDTDRTVVLFHDQDVPSIPCGSIGINRIGVFNSRIDIAKAVENFKVEAIVDTNSLQQTFARALMIKGKGIKIDYRCANPQTIQAPKAMHDPAIYQISMTSEAIQMMQRGKVAMSTDDVTFIGTDQGVSLEMSDINGDKLTYQFADSIKLLTDDETSEFSHCYPTKMLISLFKTNTNGCFQLTTKGMLKIIVNNLTVFVLAKE